MKNKSSAGARKNATVVPTVKVSSMQSSQLMKLFEDGLKDIYWAEKALIKNISKMSKNATSIKLSEALDNHLEETYQHVERLDEVFQVIDKKAVGKKCVAMEGLIDECVEIMESCEKGSMRDAGIIAGAQKIEHYEIATYGTLRQFAETLGLKKAVALLSSTLEDEKSADETLSEVATSAINIDASTTKSKK
ncbi:MAG: ferritin-like domain-containing protein [Chitinophagales bacterium]|jgi:ferritin-like metal-binding protein YciE|nr:ferritin-like domain-containing protein [Bacteroidota bacterium]MBK9557006.1 ferritin-like domain-containing protein [Bacteroidota bacterium]MBL0280993.1 ferritin-like domain-containing protein [Bacteroidota bacterium]MBP9878645.1 ferritin-like domain-containing protein [Chitinophagales bacterium]